MLICHWTVQTSCRKWCHVQSREQQGSILWLKHGCAPSETIDSEVGGAASLHKSHARKLPNRLGSLTSFSGSETSRRRSLGSFYIQNFPTQCASNPLSLSNQIIHPQCSSIFFWEGCHVDNLAHPSMYRYACFPHSQLCSSAELPWYM